MYIIVLIHPPNTIQHSVTDLADGVLIKFLTAITYSVPIPDFDNTLVDWDDILSGFVEVHLLDGQPVHVVFHQERSVRPDVVQ